MVHIEFELVPVDIYVSSNFVFSLLRDYMILVLVRSFKPYFDLSLFRLDDSGGSASPPPFSISTHVCDFAFAFLILTKLMTKLYTSVFVFGSQNAAKSEFPTNIQRYIRFFCIFVLNLRALSNIQKRM